MGSVKIYVNHGNKKPRYQLSGRFRLIDRIEAEVLAAACGARLTEVGNGNAGRTLKFDVFAPDTSEESLWFLEGLRAGQPVPATNGHREPQYHDYVPRWREPSVVAAQPSRIASQPEARVLDLFVEQLRETHEQIGYTTFGDLETDLWIEPIELLGEAKRDGSRGSIRMAIGQLVDYDRHRPAQQWLILVPVQPADDVRGIVSHAEELMGRRIRVIWKDDDGWAGDTEGLL